MKPMVKKLGWLGVALLVTALLFGCATQQVQKAEEKSPEQIMMASDWKFHDIVDAAFVRQYAKVPQPEGVTIIDSRPFKPKYIKGHIPTAINLPDSQFDKLVDKLPKDKNDLLIFYCGGYACKLSHKSAWKAEKLGYNNVKVFAAGYPAYLKAPGSYADISVEYLATLLDENELVLVDSRPKKPKFDKGHIPSAISIPDSDFDKLKGKLPVDQNTPLVFYCGGYT